MLDEVKKWHEREVPGQGWGYLCRRKDPNVVNMKRDRETNVKDEPKQVNRTRTIELPDWDSPGDKLNIIVGHFIWI